MIELGYDEDLQNSSHNFKDLRPVDDDGDQTTQRTVSIQTPENARLPKNGAGQEIKPGNTVRLDILCVRQYCNKWSKVGNVQRASPGTRRSMLASASCCGTDAVRRAAFSLYAAIHGFVSLFVFPRAVHDEVVPETLSRGCDLA